MTDRVAWVAVGSALLGWQLQVWLAPLGFEARLCSADDLRAGSPVPPALVCVELLVPGGNGFALLRHLAARYDCPRVLITGSGRRTDLAWGLRAGATAVLERPLTPAALAAALRGALQ